METIDFATLFQGFGTMMESGWLLSSARVFLIALGLLLIYRSLIHILLLTDTQINSVAKAYINDDNFGSLGSCLFYTSRCV